MIKKYTLFALLLVLVGLIQAKCDYSKVSLSSTNSCNVYKFTVNGVTDTCNHLDIKIFKSGGTTAIGPFTTAVFYQTFADTGSYYVRVSIKNKCCGSDTLFYNLIRVTCKPTTSKCNWKSRNMYFSVWDSCAGVKNKVSVNGYIGPFNGCYKYYWTVNGVSVSTARMMSYGITTNGTYNVCMKVVDTCNQCDTTFCSSRAITCAKTCSWAPKRSAYFSAWDSCTGKTHKYSLNGYFGPMNSCYKYTWTVDGVVVGTGRMISYPITKNGTYVFCIKATDTCTGCDTMICSSRVITCATAGTVNARHDAGIVIFPNPSRDQLTIQCTSKNATYCIMDSKGSMVKSGQLIHEISSIDVSELPRGIYSVSVITANCRSTQIQVLH
ncbi:MAG: T9SS C-terminal target domain-containing protein [Bacteroidetes bacterium]|jgi:hypothetical protein|nr:T9SS C-terminal target domain-containing protein [Bacteroidota bacterium]